MGSGRSSEGCGLIGCASAGRLVTVTFWLLLGSAEAVILAKLAFGGLLARAALLSPAQPSLLVSGCALLLSSPPVLRRCWVWLSEGALATTLSRISV